MSKIENILFICKHNRFRSRVAEAYFKKINKNPQNKAKSAGLIRGLYPLSKNQVRVAREMGMTIEGRPQGLSIKLLKWADYHIITADDVPVSLFNKSEKFGKKLIIWKIPDAHSKNIPAIRHSIYLIKSKIEDLVKKLS
jgi:protein-tyrosine-phosphatase